MSNNTAKVDSSSSDSKDEKKKKKKDGVQKGNAKVKVKRFKEPIDRRTKLTKNGLTKDYVKFLRRTFEDRVGSIVEPIKPIDVIIDENGTVGKKERHRRHHIGASELLVSKGLKLGDIVKTKKKNREGYTMFALSDSGTDKLRGAGK